MKDHLRSSSLPTDVTFVFHVFQAKDAKQRKHMHDVVFPAHRHRLLAASPYFESLLAGDWKQTDEVSIEDCQPGAFRILLRWIYGPQVFATVLDSVRPSTFIAVLLAAERFDMKDLVNRLLGVAMLILEQTDSFLYKLLDMLDHRQIACGRGLAEICLHYLDNNAAALTKHASFLDISHERLKEILNRNSLGIHEIDLYRAATKWARTQLKRANKCRTDRAIRDVLGDALFLIRFPTMHPQEFKSGPAKENILSAEEKLAVYDRILSAGPTACAFSPEPRTGSSSLPLRNFTPTYCQKCGARLSGDTCPECGCSYHMSVECDGCGKRAFVDTKAFVYAACENDVACYAVAFRCSCGAPNTTEKHGRVRCKRCGLKVWLCMENDKISQETCKCDWCREVYPEDYSDGELTSSEDYNDADDGDGDDKEGADAH
ncbi:hypothetical protein AAVH_26655 [Aphelenchoides avenae]|nr:hypothetical protein AAVH_26655 [Aphelenchus avenae]